MTRNLTADAGITHPEADTSKQSTPPSPPSTPPAGASAAAQPGEPAPRPRVRIGSPVALLAVVPRLLKFAPARSIVIVGTARPGAEVRVTLRYDLPDPADHRQAAAIVRHVLGVLSAQCITCVAAVGYGPDALVSPVARKLRERAERAGITVFELLREEGNRYWSYVCADPACCPPEGTPYDVTDHPVARAFADVGAGAEVLASREELAASVAAADGEQAEAVHRAIREVEEQVTLTVTRLRASGARQSASRLTAALTAVVGSIVVRDVIDRYRAGESISPRSAACAAVALRELRVRDDAWARMQPEHRAAHLRLWTDLTRLAPPGYLAAPATLLAFVAWQSGNGALGNIAIDRALADDPRYSMALLIRRAMDAGAPPGLARLPMTPEEVAASYDAQEAGEAAAGAQEPDGSPGGQDAREGEPDRPDTLPEPKGSAPGARRST